MLAPIRPLPNLPPHRPTFKERIQHVVHDADVWVKQHPGAMGTGPLTLPPGFWGKLKQKFGF
ncbi:MAG: hypothetical protein JWM80_5002 [Cyanobacteria bacterium RYN_339]|nr:hypothetical protein [Cyanobacteria bacterium RYN_339]